MILLTDGNSNNEEETIEQAFLAKQEGIHIITIAVGTWLRQDELDTISSFPTEQNSIKVRNFEDLLDIVQDIKHLVCNSKYEDIEISGTKSRHLAPVQYNIKLTIPSDIF